MLWDHQIHLSRRAADILLKLHIVYLSIEMRVGKTLIALETAKLLSAKNVLFVTKKKAISSILNDYKTEGYTFKLTVTNYEQLHKFKPEYDLVVADEAHCCFKGTLIDGTAIEQLKEGDEVFSFNHLTQSIEKKPIEKIFKRTIKDTAISLCLGNNTLLCTLQHPIYVIGRGYIKAQNLQIGDMVYEFTNLQDLWERISDQQQNLQDKPKSRTKRFWLLLYRVFLKMATHSVFNKSCKRIKIKLRNLWQRNFKYWNPISTQIETGNSDLFSGVPYGNEVKDIKAIHDTRNVISVIGQDDKQQPDEKRGDEAESVRNIKNDGAQTESQRGQRTDTNTSTKNFRETWRLVHSGVCRDNSKRNQNAVSNADFVQNRLSGTNQKDRDRSGRGEPRITLSQSKRQEETNGLRAVRVENITLLEYRGDERVVYNLRVRDNNNYFANNILTHNCTGHYPKPNLCAQRLKDIVGHANLMLLSGTPTPESYSQIFHQFWISRYNPFNLESFYKWAHIYVNIKQKIINSQRFNDYDEAREEEIMRVLQPYFISYTQEQAGFRQQTIEEDVVNVSINPNIHKLVKIVLKDKYYKFKDGNELVCDTAVKLQQKIHQIYSGTIKLEDGSYKILDNSKAEFIKVNYSHRKIAIYYKFIAEGDILRQTFPNWTDNPEKFKADDSAVFLSQIQSGAMGINLASAELLIFYNIDFSFTNYWQSRNRIQSLSRATVPRVIWIFASEGIESKIYSTVLKKKDYTTYYFTKDFLNGERYSNKNNKVA